MVQQPGVSARRVDQNAVELAETQLLQLPSQLGNTHQRKCQFTFLGLHQRLHGTCVCTHLCLQLNSDTVAVSAVLLQCLRYYRGNGFENLRQYHGNGWS